MPEDEPKWRRRKEARPVEIVEAAMEVFAEKGFHNTTIRDICEQAGANIAAVNYHFQTKEQLYAAVLEPTS